MKNGQGGQQNELKKQFSCVRFFRCLNKSTKKSFILFLTPTVLFSHAWANQVETFAGIGSRHPVDATATLGCILRFRRPSLTTRSERSVNMMNSRKDTQTSRCN